MGIEDHHTVGQRPHSHGQECPQETERAHRHPQPPHHVPSPARELSGHETQTPMLLHKLAVRRLKEEYTTTNGLAREVQEVYWKRHTTEVTKLWVLMSAVLAHIVANDGRNQCKMPNRVLEEGKGRAPINRPCEGREERETPLIFLAGNAQNWNPDHWPVHQKIQMGNIYPHWFPLLFTH